MRQIEAKRGSQDGAQDGPYPCLVGEGVGCFSNF